jgi:hypothetical protein
MYDKLISNYQKLWGSDNVLVLPFELFSLRPHEYIYKLSRFIDVDIHFENLPFSQKNNIKKNFISEMQLEIF